MIDAAAPEGTMMRQREIITRRPSADQSVQIEASRSRVAESRKICRGIAELVRETHETIDRSLEKLDSLSE